VERSVAERLPASPNGFLRLEDIAPRVFVAIAEASGTAIEDIGTYSRLVEDCGCDSIDFLDLIFRLEKAFDIEIRHKETPFKELFTRKPFRVADLVECVYIRQGSGPAPGRRRKGLSTPPPTVSKIPFTQLGGRYRDELVDRLWELWGSDNDRHFHRRSDGMRCIAIPAATVELGTDDPADDDDARPQHRVRLDGFLMDAEAVSTTAYCRFLNSIGVLEPRVLSDWFVLELSDDRRRHELIEFGDGEWAPKAGVERKPMTLVSWYGANAYSLWAHQGAWWDYRAADTGGPCFLPTEAQWEYAARGALSVAYPWGNEPVDGGRMNFGRHTAGDDYAVAELPLADVNAELGMSPFGLHHMAGNVWQWCRDWYAADFYQSPAASEPNAVNLTATGVRSERGGSFVGPAELCRSFYRRGRNPEARGRCLGFRCVGPAMETD
jgi:formylglycine-generating enzyme